MVPPSVNRSNWPADLARLLDRACQKFEAALQKGKRPDLQQLLAKVPARARPFLQAELQALEQAYREQLRIQLSVTSGPHQGRIFTLAGHDTFIVGRSKRAHFRLAAKDKYFSRFHFVVEVNPPQCRLLDMNSRNGTFVNGKRVTAADLNDGDEIKAGHTTLRVAFLCGDIGPKPSAEEQVTSPTIILPSIVPVQLPAIPAVPLAPGLIMEAALPAAPLVAPSTDACQPCRICAAGALPASATPEFPWPVCSICLGHIRQQAQSIPGYALIRKLGQGGMGTVYLALRYDDGMLVAMKTILPASAGSPTAIARFLREVSILAELRHRNIVHFHDAGEAKGLLFFIMDYVAGADAKQLLKANGAFSVERAVRLTCQVLEALEYAHELGYVHRDIKPANLLVTTEDSFEMVKLADFGLARVYQESNLSGLTLQGQVGGTFGFMPPEQITNFRQVKPAGDQYAAAAMLYNLLTDQYIFDLPDEYQARMSMILEEEPVPIRARSPEIPEALAAIIHRALAKEPAKRFRDVCTLRSALMQWCY